MDRWILKSKHVIVEAAQLTGDNVEALAAWCKGTIVDEEDKLNNRMFSAINVPTSNGTKRLSHMMYLVKWQDDFYVAQPGQFEVNYTRMTLVGMDPREAKKLPKFQKEPWFDAPKPGDPNYGG